MTREEKQFYQSTDADLSDMELFELADKLRDLNAPKEKKKVSKRYKKQLAKLSSSLTLFEMRKIIADKL